MVECTYCKSLWVKASANWHRMSCNVMAAWPTGSRVSLFVKGIIRMHYFPYPFTVCLFTAQVAVKCCTRHVFNLGVGKQFETKNLVWFLCASLHTLILKIDQAQPVVFECVCFCVLVCSCLCCVHRFLSSSYTSDCRRKGQQPEAVIVVVLILRTSLCVQQPAEQQAPHCSYFWSYHTYTPLLS